jgi:exodeoxyribonuclease III
MISMFLIDIPNSGQGLVRLSYRMKWEESMRKYLASLNKIKPIIWCGDLNVAHNEIDIKNPKSNLRSAGFTVEERDCFTKLLSDGYIDSFRYLYPDLKDQYTFWSMRSGARGKNVGWRLDYFVIAEKLKENLVDNMIRSKVMGSDHCPITLFLQI